MLWPYERCECLKPPLPILGFRGQGLGSDL